MEQRAALRKSISKKKEKSLLLHTRKSNFFFLHFELYIFSFCFYGLYIYLSGGVYLPLSIHGFYISLFFCLFEEGVGAILIYFCLVWLDLIPLSVDTIFVDLYILRKFWCKDARAYIIINIMYSWPRYFSFLNLPHLLRCLGCPYFSLSWLVVFPLFLLDVDNTDTDVHHLPSLPILTLR